MTEPIETTAVVVRESEQPDNRQPITAAQAKVDAVASLTMSAYQKASQLQLSTEECEKLQADFPDEAFRSGAGGKEALIFIEHAHLRDRLNQVFGPGQWAIVPRNRWSEDFITKENKPGVRIYVEAMLCVRGCFVAEAVGDMEYYPHNAGTNYGDCVEGAKSGCLRRCAKELGIGLQAWKKDWCEGWWKRRRGQTLAGPTPFAKAAPTPPAAPKKATIAADLLPLKEATEATKTWALGQLRAQFADDVLLPYFVEHSFILPEQEKLEDWSLGLVPTTRPACTELIAKIGEWQRKKLPSDAGTGQDNWDDVDSEQAPWRAFPMPYGKNAGVKLADLDKKYLYGLWANFEVETEYNGAPKKPEAIARDQAFRVFLDDAGKHYEFTKND